MRLTGRVALVTGACRGIGRATALALSRRGALVVLAARTVEPGTRLAGSLQETAATITADGGEVHTVACDLNDAGQVEALATAALAWRGRVDILVNNAAFLGKATFHDLDQLTLENWQRQFNINVTAPFLLAKALVPAMRESGSGVIVNVTSAAGEFEEGDVPGLAYGVTKAAVNRLTLGLSRDLREAGITVFAVDPGHVRTEIAEQAAEHPGWDIDIDGAHPPLVAAETIADLIETAGAQVSGRVWVTVAGYPPQLRHDGRAPGPA